MVKGPPPDYVEVSERIHEFRQAHPDGVLQSEIVTSPVDGFVVVKAYAYRSPEDVRPGTGLAWEPIPGKTNFTRDSELMNAETSAWGRAIVAVGAADAKRGIASANEVRNRQSASEPPKGPEDRIRERVKAAGLVDAFVNYLAAVHGTNKLDDLDTVSVREVLTLTESDDGLDVIRDYTPAEVTQ